MVGGASLAIKLIPFRHVVTMAAAVGRKVVGRRGRNSRRIGDLLWAVEGVSRQVPWRTVCFQKGLALHLMLRRRGVPSLLHYGVRQTPEQGLTAHVWVTIDGNPVIGGAEAGNFKCLATYPAIA